MTGRTTPSPDSGLHLLQEAGVDEDPALLEAVQDIAELAERPVPEPSAELAQLMASGGRIDGSRRVKGRITFIGGALAVSMGVGMSGVAAGPADRQAEPDRSVDSVARSWALDHVEKATPAPVAGPDVVVSPPPSSSSDAVPPDSPDEAAPVPPGPGGDVPSDGVLAGGSLLVGGLPYALPAARPGAAPSSITGVTVSSPLRQPASGSEAASPLSLSTNTSDRHASAAQTSDRHTSAVQTSDRHASAAQTSDRHTSAAQTSDRHASAAQTSDRHASVAQGEAGTSAGSTGESGDTAARGPAEAHESAGHASRYVEEPVGFATLCWVDEDPDESMPDAAPALVLRASAAVPDNMAFLAAPLSDDGQWLALFVPQVTELTWDAATEEYVPWEPVSREDAPDGAVASPDFVPEAPVEVTGTLVPGVQPPPEALDGESDAVGPVPPGPNPVESAPAEPLPAEPLPAKPLPTLDAPVPAGEPSEAIPVPGPADGAPDEPPGSPSAGPADEPATGR